MLSYDQLQQRPKDFLAMTGLQLDEFLKLLAAFEATYLQRYRHELTLAGKARQRRAGGGAKGVLRSFADKLLFILVYQKTNPLQTAHALQFGMSQPQANYWIHHLLPILRATLEALGMQPARDASHVAHHPFALEGGPDLAIDGTERRRQRPVNASQQKEHYSGKKKTHTDKNLLLVNAHTGKVVYLSPTVAGKRHDKKMADEVAIAYPANATLDKDTGFQGYEPEGVLSRQPKKTAREGTECR
jgi:Helix-turn-helix of DDE superfamily endonuclease/DDE superfamily endonuclease